MSRTKIVCVVGPTASGKTSLSIEIARRMGGEIICADSMQIYKGMTIASAAPSAEECRTVPHHLNEFLEYGESFTVAQYVEKAREKIEDISSRGRLPIIVGGTGLYISSLVNNISFLPLETDFELRRRLEAQMDEKGGEEMLKMLYSIDPATALKLHPNDRRRIVRAFEIYYSSGETKTYQDEESRRQASPYSELLIGINYRERATLYDRINRRVDAMLSSGLLAEARAAFDKDIKDTSGAVQAIGHKELFPHFRGEKPLEECLENLKQASRRYAKRQLTWFSKDERINWLYPDSDGDIFNDAVKLVQQHIKE